MSTQTLSPAVVSGSEDVPLAQVKNVGSSEVLAAVALVASLATALFGHDFGITKNAQAIAQVAVILIPMATSFARSHKHRGIALANAQVVIAQIKAASDALIAAQQSAAPGPTPQSATTSAPSEPGGPTVTYGYSADNPAAPGRHASLDVGADLPVVALDDAGHGEVGGLLYLAVVVHDVVSTVGTSQRKSKMVLWSCVGGSTSSAVLTCGTALSPPPSGVRVTGGNQPSAE